MEKTGRGGRGRRRGCEAVGVAGVADQGRGGLPKLGSRGDGGVPDQGRGDDGRSGVGPVVVVLVVCRWWWA